MQLVILVPIAGILAVLFALWLAYDVLRRDTGTKEMQDVAGLIFEGAMAFLRRQYTTIAAIAVVAAVVIGVVVATVSDGVHRIEFTGETDPGTIRPSSAPAKWW
jgi:K(+)-stimulated pyrophosphate-energized sodium pump